MACRGRLHQPTSEHYHSPPHAFIGPKNFGTVKEIEAVFCFPTKLLTTSPKPLYYALVELRADRHQEKHTHVESGRTRRRDQARPSNRVHRPHSPPPSQTQQEGSEGVHWQDSHR